MTAPAVTDIEWVKREIADGRAPMICCGGQKAVAIETIPGVFRCVLCGDRVSVVRTSS